MAQFIPLDSTVFINRSGLSEDEWGLPNEVIDRAEYKARTDFNGNSRLIQTPGGKEVIFVCQIYIKGSVPISYTDSVEYYSPVSGWVSDHPKQIVPMNDLSGKTMYTRITV